MSESAKDEAELLDAMVDAIWKYLTPDTRWTSKPYVERDLAAAIRAAGWAVVPVEPTEMMIRATDRDEHFLWTDDEITKWEWAAMLAAAPGVKP